MMRKIFPYCFLFLILISCSNKEKKSKSITVFAAASVTNVIQEIAKSYSKETGVKIRLNIASSGILARQIESGADFDYYISASKTWMDYVDSNKLVAHNSVCTVAGNSLVAIVPNNSEISVIDTSNIYNFPKLFRGRLSLGDPGHVPVGKYSVQVLKYYQCNETLLDRYLPAKNARDALFMVEMAECGMGMVYASDAINSQKVKIIYEFPDKACDPIRYYAAISNGENQYMNQFLEFMKSDQVKEIWKRNGFKDL